MTQREFRMTKPKGTGGGSFRSRLAQLRAKAAGDCRTPRRWRAHRAQREITPNSWRMKFEKRPMKTEKLSQIKPNKTTEIYAMQFARLWIQGAPSLDSHVLVAGESVRLRPARARQ